VLVWYRYHAYKIILVRLPILFSIHTLARKLNGICNVSVLLCSKEYTSKRKHMPSVVIAHIFSKYINERNRRGTIMFQSKKVNFDGVACKSYLMPISEAHFLIQYLSKHFRVSLRKLAPYMALHPIFFKFTIYIRKLSQQ
jgi:hypothetical protein